MKYTNTMGNNYFKLKSKIDVNALKDSDKLYESDFSLFTSKDEFLQFEYVDGEEDTSVQKYIVKSGIYNIALAGQRLVLRDAAFLNDALLNEYVVTKDITDKIDTFFSKLDVYKKYNIFPKRGMLLYGSAGCGKSVAISKICTEYANNPDTLVVIWPSDQLEARHVKSFIKSFDYDTNSIKKMILVIEDLGGTEHTDRGLRPSESSLLSLLDNVDRTFSIPTMIVATTNYPENFLENLTNRPQRFDDVMEVKRPTGEFRAKFLDFFNQAEAPIEVKNKIKEKKYDGLSVAHVKEVVIRAALYGITLEQSLDQVLEQSAKAVKSFSNSKKMGFSFDD